jgi:Double zinc ribbon
MKCLNCKAESEGRFCSNCGTPLAGATCTTCRAKLAPGAKFCTQCGESVHARSSYSQLPWIIAGAGIVVAIVALLLPGSRGSGGNAGAAGATAPPFASMGSTPGGTGTPPPLTGTPREQADRLFNRIMQERSAGNEEQAKFFVPMATQAYQASAPLDDDGLYHLSLIQAVGGDFAASAATANSILRNSPNHLLGLAALAEADTGAGDSAGARQAWQRFLDHLAEEKAKDLEEYRDHTPILSQYEEDARKATGR